MREDESDMGEAVTFKGSFPAIQSAIKIDGSGGARIQIEIPESEVGNFIRAMTWRGKVLVITMEPEILTNLDDGKETEANDAEQTDERPTRRTSKVGRGRS